MRLSATPAGLQSGERSSDDRVSTSAGVSPMRVQFYRMPDSVDTTISELRRRDEEGTSDKGLPIRQETHPQTLLDTTSRDNVGVVLKRWDPLSVFVIMHRCWALPFDWSQSRVAPGSIVFMKFSGKTCWFVGLLCIFECRQLIIFMQFTTKTALNTDTEKRLWRVVRILALKSVYTS